MGREAHASPQEKAIHPSLLLSLESWEKQFEENAFLAALEAHGEELGPLRASLAQAWGAWSGSNIFDKASRFGMFLEGIWPTTKLEATDFQKEEMLRVQERMIAVDALIYQTYVSVVLGRTDAFVDALGKIGRRSPATKASAAAKFLRSDEVRHLRNAIGHGTFIVSMTEDFMEYWDGKFRRSIGFQELGRLNSAIWKIVFTCYVAAGHWSDLD